MNEGMELALSVLRQAMGTELEGRVLYLEAVERTEDELGQRMFRSLAQDEEKHLEILQVQYGAITGTGQWLDLEAAKKEEPDLSLHLFPQEEEAKEGLIPEDASDLDALKIAMDFERRGYRLYEKAAAETSDPTAQAIFRFLVEEESKHFALLDNAHDYLANQGIWYFDDLEKPFFEG
ncbi:MAG: ferritin family protein [Anaerolineae bacterium]